MEMWWQTKANLAVPLAFTCCFLNDLGELTEIMYEGHKLSKTGAVECSRFSRKGKDEGKGEAKVICR
jgi:hypothetical protein